MGFDVVSARGESVFTHKMLDVTNAVILMAGSGSRLRASGRLVPKPLVPVLEKPLICYTLDSLRQAGITTVHAVVGFESDRLLTELDRLVPKSMEFRSIENPNWEKKNGISLLAAAKYVVAPFLLVMADHLFEYSLVDILLRHAHPNFLNLAVDRKIESVFYLA